jgi:transposase
MDACGAYDPIRQHGGRKRSVNMRKVLNGIFYVLWAGCQWRHCRRIPYSPKSTVHDHLELWNGEPRGTAVKREEEEDWGGEVRH